METSQLYRLAGYDYQLGAYPTLQGSHRGLIFLMAFAGTPFSPAIKIPTPTNFRSEQAARIEASALAYQLILTGLISTLIPHDDCPEQTICSQ